MRVLAADIGGTNARFAVFETKDGRPFLLRKNVFSSQSSSFEEALKVIQSSWPEAQNLDAVSVAAAGPVDNGVIRMTNAAFTVEVAKIHKIFPKAQIYLLNDFEAQAYGLGSEGITDDLESIYIPKSPFKSPIRTVIGAGTGFGTGWLLFSKPLRVIAGELGHIPQAFDETERDLAKFIETQDPGAAPTIEHILCGKGLTQLHNYFTGLSLEPKEITATPHFESSETCASFARFYGRAARTAALAVLTESIVIGGGIARKCPAFVTHPNFIEEFLRYIGPHRAYLERVRIDLDKTGDLGLKGALLKSLQQPA